MRDLSGLLISIIHNEMHAIPLFLAIKELSYLVSYVYIVQLEYSLINPIHIVKNVKIENGWHVTWSKHVTIMSKLRYHH